MHVVRLALVPFLNDENLDLFRCVTARRMSRRTLTHVNIEFTMSFVISAGTELIRR